MFLIKSDLDFRCKDCNKISFVKMSKQINTLLITLISLCTIIIFIFSFIFRFLIIGTFLLLVLFVGFYILVPNFLKLVPKDKLEKK